ncbi:3-hydroxybutyrate dehydrogenase [Thermoflavimicrobium dichotomicum]|uniref:3-hydroxybutyrate dehydrogenase n=1 Tax=Thermoflavimicrobium dichotomicum TaxID=46223 RepID=A0A1I3UNT1_9BACL|nr:3-hydroxybutyrate dehydrogenase [Thermoflavimicrobium dichotomicum]SFJ84359.1 3-hydroxybutyrate dehydrogenase [Thermoflavimicrobium dichotomicum]
MNKQRTVIVTGAAGTIGFAIAQAFAREGDHVVIVDINEEGAIQAAKQLSQETGNEASAYAVDITDEGQVKRLVETVIEKRGSIDIIVNNAGLQHIDKVEDFPLEKWNYLIGVMLTGPFLLIKHTVPWMKKQQYGRIINISSVHGKTASPFKSAYIASKHGLVGLSRTVALETADDGITVNCILPGVVDTPLIRNQLQKLSETEGISQDEALHKHLLNKQALKRFIKPEEIAACAVYLASDLAAGVTGEEISVSGGW